MTENKRFTITQDYEEYHRQIRDNGHIIMGCFIEPQAEVIVDLLNQLNDENEQLKSENNMLKVTIGRNEAYIDRLKNKGEWDNHFDMSDERKTSISSKSYGFPKNLQTANETGEVTKVSLKDIIGLVHTDEQTNSVELKKEIYEEEYNKTHSQ